MIAIDGRERRSAKRGGHDMIHLVAATEHATGTVLGQVNLLAKTNEVRPAVPPAGAAHRTPIRQGKCRDRGRPSHADVTTQLICGTYQDHYVITEQGNQPGLYAQVENNPWDQVQPEISRKTPAMVDSCTGS
ncbi:hypothetical protein FQ154_20545 [Paeniglutamicibacter gangotriensis]|uniref:Uncharacterized protein n=1 Tax=Paeniglutamicibacter gangotriensis TaxID=254787 RepID=A0A5B0DUG2_9MICC|nr:hypothetical protein FQ154_20545 [Paeniglutamicibacter gangotriensis]